MLADSACRFRAVLYDGGNVDYTYRASEFTSADIVDIAPRNRRHDQSDDAHRQITGDEGQDDIVRVVAGFAGALSD